MPIYEYGCLACDAKQTETFSISVEIKPPLCPVCNKEMYRIYKIQTIIFKGNGWGKDPK